MKIIAFNGSPRGAKGNTHIMVSAFLAGAQKAGAEVENILLADKKINHCLGCFSCWVKTPGKCVIKDDMAALLEKFVVADILVFASPLYVDNVTGLFKNFIDRIIPLGNPYFEKDDNGEYRHKTVNAKAPKIIVIANCGFPEQSHFQVLHLWFQRVARNMHTEVIAEIYRGEGEAVQHFPEYQKLLHKAGAEIVNNMQLSATTKSELAKPLIPYEQYIAKAEEHIDAVLKK